MTFYGIFDDINLPQWRMAASIEDLNLDDLNWDDW